MPHNIAPIKITGHQPNKWVRIRLEHQQTGEQFEIFRSDDTSEYHLEIYERFVDEINDQPLEIVEVLDAGRIILIEPTKCHLFGYSTYFKIPDPQLPREIQLSIREGSKQTLEHHGYIVELGEIW